MRLILIINHCLFFVYLFLLNKLKFMDFKDESNAYLEVGDNRNIKCRH